MENEKRLIDANAALKKMQNWNTKQRLINCVEDAPTVDAVEVVRCKDCKYYCNGWHCNLYLNVSHETKPDHFCSYGERRDNERTD